MARSCENVVLGIALFLAFSFILCYSTLLFLLLLLLRFETSSNVRTPFHHFNLSSCTPSLTYLPTSQTLCHPSLATNTETHGPLTNMSRIHARILISSSKFNHHPSLHARNAHYYDTLRLHPRPLVYDDKYSSRTSGTSRSRDLDVYDDDNDDWLLDLVKEDPLYEPSED